MIENTNINIDSRDFKFTPKQIVEELDKYIIGQDEAKKAVAIALRNRWRRAQLDHDLQVEVKPKNILMIGPTGVGKTEIARRLALIIEAPFIKVEATKFTEVGYIGRDVETIVRDLVDVAVKQAREKEIRVVEEKARSFAIEKVLDKLLPKKDSLNDQELEGESYEKARAAYREKIQKGELDDQEIEIDLPVVKVGFEIMSPPGMEEMTSQLQSLFSSISNGRKKQKKVSIKKAIRALVDEESAKLINEDEIRNVALKNVEQNGIVFIDEIDKIARSTGVVSGADVSREGVQRDLLPLIEGCSVTTKYGTVKTDHILFITSGAFSLTKPSDLIPELQGRLPIRVELKALSSADFARILREPKASLIEQYEALLATEGVKLVFKKNALEEIANMAYLANEKIENIGARRLYTILELVLEEISFTAPEWKGKTFTIDAKYVKKILKDLFKDEDLSHYVL